MIRFADPFERILSFVQSRWDVEARVQFVSPQDLPKVPGRLFKRAKGSTFIPDSGAPAIVSVSACLKGVQGTLDILAHEMAHVVAGPEAGHGPEWVEAYREIFDACCLLPTVEREIGGPKD